MLNESCAPSFELIIFGYALTYPLILGNKTNQKLHCCALWLCHIYGRVYMFKEERRAKRENREKKDGGKVTCKFCLEQTLFVTWSPCFPFFLLSLHIIPFLGSHISNAMPWHTSLSLSLNTYMHAEYFHVLHSSKFIVASVKKKFS